MLQSTQGSYLHFLFKHQFIESSNQLRKKRVETMKDLLLPEDTSMEENMSPPPCNYSGNTTGSTIKVIFWLVVSILLSLLLGQLN